MFEPGFATRKFAGAVLSAGLLAIAVQAAGADLSLPVTGNLLGSVVDASGTPQMGAHVQLFNKFQRLIANTITLPDGRFAFANLPADIYGVRVSLASFLPASRDKIAVKPGIDSMLQIHLTTLFSNVEVSYALPTGAMTDDWRWILRSSPATRPITRLLPSEEPQSSARLRSHIFSGTHAMLSVSGGDGGVIDSDSAQGDLGTGFALSTNVLGKNQVQLGGTFGQNAGIGPAVMGLCAIYSRNQDGGFGEPPEVTLTISQLSLLSGPLSGENVGSRVGPGAPIPTLRTMSLSVYETADPADDVHLEYGATGESIDYVQHIERISPFARATVNLGELGEIVGAYSDGGRPDELVAHQQTPSAAEVNADQDLGATVNTLSRLPQLSERDGILKLQRTQNYEIGYSKAVRSRTYAVSAFHENVSNGRINVAGDLALLDATDLLSDGISETSAYNIGHYNRNGYIASVDQHLTNALDLAVAYGRMGGFAAGADAEPKSWDTQRNFLDEKDHNFASVNFQAKAPVSGTQISASYGWADSGAILPRHTFTTQNTYAQPGLNMVIRQPLPSLFGMPGRLEITADLRNLLAQGYLPLYVADERRLLIVQSPRAIRGGLNFIF